MVDRECLAIHGWWKSEASAGCCSWMPEIKAVRLSFVGVICQSCRIELCLRIADGRAKIIAQLPVVLRDNNPPTTFEPRSQLKSGRSQGRLAGGLSGMSAPRRRLNGTTIKERGVSPRAAQPLRV